ncbi:Sec-independent protein translocase protein TatB [Caenispirillum bisanense]|uniref:Sec-independent protein translocase protein TatB n=1 Tax=Caenispirillum bisanense TaxID=414052 RepID=UPI0031D415C8
MFDFGWDELGLIIVIAVLFLGPKELPHALRTLGRWVRRIRGMAREFQRHIDDVVREAELEEVRDGLKKARTMDFGREIEKQVDPTGDLTRDLNAARKDLDLNVAPRAMTPADAGVGGSTTTGPGPEAAAPDPAPTPAAAPAAAPAQVQATAAVQAPAPAAEAPKAASGDRGA